MFSLKGNHIQKVSLQFCAYRKRAIVAPPCFVLGLNPKELRGTKMGVFIGACFSESEKTWFYEKMQVNGFGVTGYESNYYIIKYIIN